MLYEVWYIAEAFDILLEPKTEFFLSMASGLIHRSTSMSILYLPCLVYAEICVQKDSFVSIKPEYLHFGASPWPERGYRAAQNLHSCI